MKVLVTGATGFVGQEVLAALHRDGHQIRILARRPASPAARQVADSCNADVRPGDIQDLSSVERACSGVDAVVHLVGIISETGRATFENVHTRGTQAVVAAARQAGVRRIVHMSALGSRPHAVSRYHQTKWNAEECIRASSLDYTIFRPSLIYGRHDQFANLFARIARYSPVVPLFGSGRSRFQPIDVQSVARAFARALTTPAVQGLTLDLCGPEALTLREIVSEVISATGRRRALIRVPSVVARAQARILELVFAGLFKTAPPLNRDQLVMLDEDNTGNGAPANTLLGLSPPRFRDGIRACLSR